MRIGSLFSGYGGLDMAVRDVLGGELAWVADIEQGPRKLLAHRHPTVPNLGDVTAVDWATVEPVDVICGGSPCQDLSTAGRRAGMRPGTRSGLWESMREAIATIRPEWVVFENVGGVLSAGAHSDMERGEGCVGDDAGGPVLRALGRVLGDLASLGFDAEWRGIRASDVGAPHQRFRVFVLAHDPAADTRGIRGHEAVEHDGRSETAGHWAGVPDQRDRQPVRPGPFRGWGIYGPAIRRWERVMGRPAPAPTDGRRLAPEFTEWMMGVPAGWITSVPGITRTEALRMCGNGVVPQQAVAAVRDCLTAFKEAAV